jgi:hypothetical protein
MNFGQALLALIAEGESRVGRIRQPVGAPGWLWVILAVAAMGFSLGHTVADLGDYLRIVVITHRRQAEFA